jgi:serine/threonine protein kinase
LPPEIHTGKLPISFLWADVYAYGITLYSLFAGKWPFFPEPGMRCIRKLCEGEHLSFDEVDIPDGMKKLISRCWNDS